MDEWIIVREVPDDRNPEPKPVSSPYWNNVAAGRKPDPLPPPTFGDRALFIFLIICLVSGFMYLTRDRGSDTDLTEYVPAYQRAMGGFVAQTT